MNAIKQAWGWLNGKKTTIAAIWWGVAVPAVAIVWPQGAPEDVIKVVGVVGLILTYFGLGHKAQKKVVGGGH